MVYLSISIIGAIILVAIAIRRLPYLRPNRLGLEIMNPKPYMAKPSLWTHALERIHLLWHNLTARRRPIVLEANTDPALRHGYEPVGPSMPGFAPSSASQITEPTPYRTRTFNPTQGEESALFWQEETAQPAGPLEIPTKGLITRRSEAQKIAHELIVQADESFRKKDWTKAERCYLQAATKDPDNARIYTRLGVIYLQTQNYKDAIEAFRGALRFDDRVASRHFNLALAYLGKRDYRSAEKGLKEAIRLDPVNEKYRKTFEAVKRQPV